MPKVSIIIPVYNAENYLARCLDSVCNQTLDSVEVICINDYSTDNSIDILNKYANKYSNLKIINCKENGGESKARNIGLEASSGEYLAFVDNDDTIDNNFCEKLYNKAVETGADIVKGEIHDIHYDGSSTYGYLNPKIREHHSKFYFAYHWWTAIYKSSLIKDNNIKFLEGYPLGGDILFLNEAIIKCKKLELVDDVYYHYCRREDSGDSKILSFEKIKSAIAIIKMISENIQATGIHDEGTTFVISSWLLQLLNYPFRTTDEKVLKFVLGELLNYYQSSKDWIKDEPEFLGVLPVVMDLIKKNDLDMILEFYKKNNSQPKMRIANLRFMHNRNRS